MNQTVKTILIAIIIGGVGGLIYQFGFYQGKQELMQTSPASIENASSSTQKVDFSVFWEAWRKLEENYLNQEKLDKQKMMYGAIKGMVNKVADSHTTFLTPKKTDEFEKEISGEYEGVGMEVAMRKNRVTVVSPLENTPAERAGLKPGDKILEVNGTSTQGMSLQKVVTLIRGPEGSEVALTIGRDGWKENRKIPLTRSVIEIPTLEFEMKEKNGEKIAYLKLYQFNEILYSKFKEKAQEVLNSGTNKIILDLRNNPGGLLGVAQKVAGWFIKEDKVVTWQDYGSEDKEKEKYEANGPSSFIDYEVVVLINGGSASGAEILAGALRDNQGIKLIGEKSFGKGSVQRQFFLEDGSSLKVTVSHWLTPNGKAINKKGLKPDIKVERTDKQWKNGEDPQLEKALEVITQSD